MHTHMHTHWTDFPRDRKTDSARRRGKRQAREGGWASTHQTRTKKGETERQSIHGIGQEERKSQMEGLKEKQKQRGGQMDERPI